MNNVSVKPGPQPKRWGAKAGNVVKVVAVGAIVGGLMPASFATAAQANCRTFTETKQQVCDRFLEYWTQNGGLAQQGFPLTPARNEVNALNGKTYNTQYFERAVFEAHPENQKPFDVLLTLLGTLQYKQKYTGAAGAPGQRTSTDNPRKFNETGKTIGGKFRAYWESKGGLAQQGFPISDEFTEKSDTDGKNYTVQYFERAVFELHPENQAPNDVQLSLLGVRRLQALSAPKYPGGAASLSGAGATFPEPLIKEWSAQYNKLYPGVKVSYQGIGSGAGRTQFINKTVDFATSDAFLTDAQFTQVGGPDKAMHIPLTMGGVVVAYNIPGVNVQLRLTGEVIANIFLEKIARWNDPSITALNPGVNLPDTRISTVHRSDSSGTTDIYTDYLSKVSAEFKTKIGKSTLPQWPGGVGAQGNPGVTSAIKATTGGVGYVEYSFAKTGGLQSALVRNKAGAFVDASGDNVADAADSLINTSIPADLRYSITDAPGPKSYPIAGTNWGLIYVDQADANKGKVLAYFLWWTTHEGQKLSEDLFYAPLPQSIVERSEAQIRRMRCGNAPCFGQ